MSRIKPMITKGWANNISGDIPSPPGDIPGALFVSILYRMEAPHISSPQFEEYFDILKYMHE